MLYNAINRNYMMDFCDTISLTISEPNPCIFPVAADCKNGGKCEAESFSTYKCNCKDGYTGKHCENKEEKGHCTGVREYLISKLIAIRENFEE